MVDAHRTSHAILCLRKNHQSAFDVGRRTASASIATVRFVDEACGYDDFGKAMVADQLKTGANTRAGSCSMQPSASSSAGGFHADHFMPDSKIPRTGGITTLQGRLDRRAGEDSRRSTRSRRRSRT
jgi:hypothetical protein